jgi:hypothetical protein
MNLPDRRAPVRSSPPCFETFPTHRQHRVREIQECVAGLALAVALIVFAAAWQSCRARTRLLARARPSGAAAETVRETWTPWWTCFVCGMPQNTSLDDRTWNDLLMDDVFAYLDRTERGVGQQMLCCPLRHADRSVATGVRAACPRRRRRWHSWHPWQFGICKLQILKSTPETESLSLRQSAPFFSASYSLAEAQPVSESAISYTR